MRLYTKKQTNSGGNTNEKRMGEVLKRNIIFIF